MSPHTLRIHEVGQWHTVLGTASSSESNLTVFRHLTILAGRVRVQLSKVREKALLSVRTLLQLHSESVSCHREKPANHRISIRYRKDVRADFAVDRQGRKG